MKTEYFLLWLFYTETQKMKKNPSLDTKNISLAPLKKNYICTF